MVMSSFEERRLRMTLHAIYAYALKAEPSPLRGYALGIIPPDVKAEVRTLEREVEAIRGIAEYTGPRWRNEQ